MKAIYTGETYISKEGEHHSSVTNGKIYDVEQYVHIDDPIYGDTFKFIDDVGRSVFNLKCNFILLDKNKENGSN
jgi:hypothetical protein